MPRSAAVYSTIVAVDMAESTHPVGTYQHRQEMRRGLDEILVTTFNDAGIPWESCYVEDRSDGKLIIVPAEFPRAQLFELLPRLLFSRLMLYNALHVAEARIRIRVAVHAGEVVTDMSGAFGPAIFHAFRILDAAPAKADLRTPSGALSLVVSESIFAEVIAPDPAAEPGTFSQIAVQLKETQTIAWLRVYNIVADAVRDPSIAAALPQFPPAVVEMLERILHEQLVPRLPLLLSRAGLDSSPLPADATVPDTITYLLDVNAGPTGLPRLMQFVEVLAEELGGVAAQQLRGWNDVRAQELQVTEELGRVREASRPPLDDRTGSRRILVLATEWFSAHGGLSTVNRRLCQALGSAGAEVYCVVLGATDEEVADAAASNVRLIKAKRLFGDGEQEALSRRPRLPVGVVPHLIIGHGRITGRAAFAVADDHFDGVPRLHILHMAPDEVEWLKLDRKNDAGLSAEERMREERALLCPPAVAAGIGPRLFALAEAELAPFPQAAEPVRIDPGFESARTTARTPPRGKPIRVLLLGRMEDRLVKGVDLAARALAHAVDLLGYETSRVELVLRGVPKAEFTEVREVVRAWSGKRSLRVIPRSYTVDSEELEQDLLRATLVLMPSRAEGFGLVGLEAIVTATPVLVSDLSGLADLLRAVLGDAEPARLIVPITDDEKKDTQRWGAAIAAVLKDPEGAFNVAERVRIAMAKERTWLMAAQAVLRVIG